MDSHWRQVFQTNIDLPNDDPDGGAPLRTPVTTDPDDGNHKMSTTTANYRATAETASDTSSGGIPLKIRTGVDNGKDVLTRLEAAGVLAGHGKNIDKLNAPAKGNASPTGAVASSSRRLSPLATSFTPQVANTMAEVLTTDNEKGKPAKNEVDIMAMIADTHPHLFDTPGQANTSGLLSRSRTNYDGFKGPTIERDSGLRRSGQANQPAMTSSASMSSVLSGQGQTGNTLRASRTAPDVHDPFSVAAILGQDNGHDSTLGMSNNYLDADSDDDIATIEAKRKVLLAALDQLPPPRRVPGSSIMSGVITNSQDNHDHSYRQRLGDTTTPRTSRKIRRLLGCGHGNNLTSVPETHQLGPGGIGNATQTLALHGQDLQPSRQLAVPGGRMFYPPTAEQVAVRSHQLNEIAGVIGTPKVDILLDPKRFPFVANSTLFTRDPNHGVLKVRNCPFSVPRSELIALFGRAARLLNDVLEPCHIILEKVTAKTQDAYIEFETEAEAEKAYQRIQENIAKGRPPRIGTRQVSIEISSQAALMRDLFPVAHGVTWEGEYPIIKTNSPFPMENFKCFISEEECSQICRHFETPGRSPFSRDCPERFIESMISTLKKMPWYLSAHITIYQQHYIFEACQRLLEQFLEELEPQSQKSSPEQRLRLGHERLTPQLLDRFKKAILLCPGFSVVQKDSIAHMLGLSEQESRAFSLPRQAHSWNHFYALGPKPGVAPDVIEYYISILRMESTRDVNRRQPVHTKQHLEALAAETDISLFGYFFKDVGHPTGHAMDNSTLADAANREWSAVNRVICRAIHFGPDYIDDGSNSNNTALQLGGPSCAGLLTN
ncbi:hypothetical protein TruAng_010431 [Truncatella angustata]|nr:hypothetical protein TruAng_010431 [Truncatella angustata]